MAVGKVSADKTIHSSWLGQFL